MKTKTILVLLFFVANLVACSEGGNTISATQAENSTSSQSTATQAASDLVAGCVSCHGENGISTNTDWPNLAGQQSEYLYQQIRLFRDGTRQSASMPAELLTGLDEAQLRSIADHYAKIEVAIKPAALDQGGSDELPGAHVRARCVSCHGMDGISVTGLWPNIAGQQAGYTAKQLFDYKSGARKHPLMQVIANELTAQQIEDVAQYYAEQ